MTPQRLLVPLLAISVIFIFGVVMRYTASPSPGAIWHPVRFGAESNADGTSWNFQDFSAHLNYARGVWQKIHPEPYSTEAHLPIYQAWLGITPPAVLPFSYSPVALLIGLPLLPLPTAIAYVVYVILALTFFTLFVVRILSPWIQTPSQRYFIAASFGSAAFFTNVGVGQTALITTAITGWCWSLLRDPKNGGWKIPSFKLQVVLGLLLFLYSSKPNLAATLGVLLLAGGAWPAVITASGAFLLTFVALAPWLGGFPRGLIDYIQLLSKFNQEAIGPLFRDALDPLICTNLQSFLVQTPWISPSVAVGINYLCWIGGTVGALALTRLKPRLGPVPFMELLLAFFLLFCPNVNSTEDIVLCLLIGISPFFRDPKGWPLKLFLVLLVMNGNQNAGLLHGTFLASIPIAFLAKATLAVWGLWARLWPMRTRNTVTH